METPSISSLTIATAEPSATEPAASAPAKQPKKGKGAKHRDAERFRLRKNKEFDNSRQKALRAKLSPGVTVESLFGLPRQTTARPAVSRLISTVYISVLAECMIETLRGACKVLTEPEDVLTLALVTVLQVESKVWFSQQASPFAMVDHEIEQRARRSKAVLPVSLFPMSVYIDQIGSFEFEHQQVIPQIYDLKFSNAIGYLGRLGVNVLPPNTVILPANNPLTGVKQWVTLVNPEQLMRDGIISVSDGTLTFSDAFLSNPNDYPWVGNMRIGPAHDIIPTFDELVNNFNRLIGRVSRRVVDATSPIDYSTARGTEAQLVTSLSTHSDTMVEAWSNRFISDDMLTMGTLLRYGHDLIDTDDSHRHENRCVESIIETAGALQRFCRNIVSKMR